ncbi:MAG: rhodanese-like domain-containing protein [Hyphomicrobiales bacterium]
MSLPTVTPADAKRLIDQGATLIDIREVDERARERIPGSQHEPLARMKKFAGVNAPIIFHCRSGMRTASNAERLEAAAPCDAYILSGGIEAWKRADLPVITDKSQPIEINRQVMIAAGSLVLLFVFSGFFVSTLFFAFAGLVGVGLVFGGVSGWCGMAKLLGPMPWNRRAVGA